MEPPKLPGKNDSGAVDSDSRIKLDEKFWKNFRHRFGEIEAEISHLSSNDDSLRAHLDTLKRSCQALQQEVTDATLYLPKYSLKRAQEQLSQLRTLLSTREDELAPKKKFSFSSRKKEANVDGVVAPTPAVKSSFKPLSSVDEKSTVGFCNVTNETLKLTDDAIRHCDVELSDLDDCIVHIQGSPPSVHISRLSNTKYAAC
jgi:predicted RNase H-like nuclease (RuvC/YqgF family)